MAGVKLAKQAYDVIPDVIKAGGDGMRGGQMLTGVGFPAAEGWYASSAAPHVTDEPSVAPFIKAYTTRFAQSPSDYAITAYDGTLVILNAIRQVAQAGKSVTRDTVRDAIQAATLHTLQGDLAFDANGDLQSKVVSLYQIKKDPSAPLDDLQRQFRYIGVAPSV